MKRTSILLIIISLAFTSIEAQQKADIQQIRKWYNATKERIAFSKKNKLDGSLYCNLVEENVHGTSWRAVGTYHVKSRFWYNDQPDFLDNPRTGLEMVIINGKSAVLEYYMEYLFHNGKPVFVFYKAGSDELRYYFKGNKLIKQLGKCKEDMYMPTASQVQQNAEVFMKQYTSDFGKVNK